MRLTKTCILTVALFSSLFAMTAFAAPDNPATAAQEVAGKPADAQYPFIAEVTGTNVYVRSGKSTADYPTAKLHKPDKVTVVGEEFGWAKIVPPRGSYSWIYKAYVKIDPDNPNMGIVTGENVRVWAGADGIDASRSMGFQTKMNQDADNIDDDDVVELRPDQPETGEYYKIKPPAGAYLWVSTEFLQYAGAYSQDKPIIVPPRPEIKPIEVTPVDAATQPSGQQPRPTFTNVNGAQQPAETTTTPPTQPVQVEIQQPQTETAVEPVEPVKPKVSVKELEYTKQCHTAAAAIDEELKKPLAIQDYSGTSKMLTTITEDKDAGKAATYAQMLLERIKRYELAKSVTATLQKQDAQLAKARQNIARAHQDQLDQMPAEALFLYTGTLKESSVYTGKTGAKRYILADEDGKIICYIIADSPAVDAQLQQNLGKTIGINGGIVSTARSPITTVSATGLKVIAP